MTAHPLTQFCVRNRLSIWLIFLSASLTATMMRPSGGAVVTFLINLGLLFAVRAVAHLEGRQYEATDA